MGFFEEFLECLCGEFRDLVVVEYGVGFVCLGVGAVGPDDLSSYALDVDLDVLVVDLV